ncbi:uncharacterized protein LAJ45_09562 [Morchella importuna]|uniref:PTR2-domain-containing protein n=1 Tax=Morchella conica CCBAS932 TaxID=1392247 RepID=A0A3N4KFN7_9PEZI|nr:uncharacterized protein LAJ45_09562 [Morchella importuna]KAH8146369.1 hypothetical protein LAJ45_09562 [Morchella importuna]RPB08288.1 PTR2-domain-containing protein [Morchella conica CCBAS932]
MSGLAIDDAVIGAKHNPALAETIPEKHESEVPTYTKEAKITAEEDDDYPTAEELDSLRRIPDKVPWKAFPIAFVELCERFSYYGTTVVFTNFIQQPLPPGSRTGAGHEGQSGALDLGQRASTGLGTFNQFWVYLMPLVGAYVADTYWGRYKTICVALGITLIGHILLIVSALPDVIENPNGSVGCFSIAIIIMGLGTGAFKANISPLVAEQYTQTRMKVTTQPSGERVILDPALTTNKIYNWFYLMINIGALVGQISMVYAEKYVGFWLSFTLPTAVLMLCPLVMFWGRNKYITHPPAGSVLSKAMRIWVLGMKGRWSINPFITYKNMNDGSFWERVKPSNFTPESKPSWMTFDDLWVDEVRRGFKACTVFLWFPLYWLTYNQINNNLTSQAAVMNTHGLPNDIMSNLDPFALIILIPLCDLVIYPALRKAGIRFTPIKRIAAGFLTGSMAMIWAAVIQGYLYKHSDCGSHAAECETTVNINVWAQTGSYVLIAISEIFASVTGLEYAFTKAPRNMRSLVMSCFLVMNAIAAAIGEAFITLSEDPLLVWNYGSMAVIAFISMLGFWIQFRNLDKQEDELNTLPEGHHVGGARDAEEHAIPQAASQNAS